MTTRFYARIFLSALLVALAAGCAQTETRSGPIDTLVKNSKKAGTTIKEGAATAVERIKEGAASASESISKTLKK